MSSCWRIADPVPPLKEQLARELVARVDGWTLEYAASFLGTDAPRMSNLRRGRLERFSLEHLIRLIAKDHGTVTLHVTWSSRWQKLRDQRDQRDQRNQRRGRGYRSASATSVTG